MTSTFKPLGLRCCFESEGNATRFNTPNIRGSRHPITKGNRHRCRLSPGCLLIPLWLNSHLFPFAVRPAPALSAGLGPERLGNAKLSASRFHSPPPPRYRPASGLSNSGNAKLSASRFHSPGFIPASRFHSPRGTQNCPRPGFQHTKPPVTSQSRQP